MSANATERGVNPYRPNHIGATEGNGPVPDPYDARAKGVDGDMLDAMMKGRWQEGYAVGDADGRNAMRQRFPEIYDDGFNSGLATGVAEESARMASVFLPLLQEAGSTLAAVAGKTGSAEIKELCNGRIAEIAALLDEQVGRHAETQAGASV